MCCRNVSVFIIILIKPYKENVNKAFENYSADLTITKLQLVVVIMLLHNFFLNAQKK